MPSDLWSFTLDFYARPGVEEACLRLQTNGANVCMVLLGVWLGKRGVKCDARRLQEIGQLAMPWHDDVVRPLRELRTQWRDAARLDPALGSLRERVKALELEAEQQLLARLQTLTQDWPVDEAEDLQSWLNGLAAEAADKDRDALQRLRVAADQP
ncbi:TIGR02444 family protein [Pseudomonas cichorii]|nr:TIGR02444 family protein [Pseudomonas cichorii]MBX8512218.1 TIGR02444 family protein [Pseudomonas cichorii]MBX8521127.1 TIGR02444 family protein [Pseudomonas cichorii]MBX8527199.1 TIGR02444 family protein [Pseudomonas cichorii]MBX8553815.1 TIGR02444 family protein [Pseudomonas cichorii]MBX8589524.1 TIGR02444 family protein [Pseudomonas cichorii]